MIRMKEADEVRITILADDRIGIYRAPLLAEHGFSALIEVTHEGDSFKFLFDTGASGEVVVHNAKTLGVDLSEISHVILSHRHYDHTGGLAKLTEFLPKGFVTIAHPDILKPALVTEPQLANVGPPAPSLRIIKEHLIPLSRPVEIFPGVLFLGEIARTHGLEKPQGFYTVHEGALVVDEMLDDTAVAIRVRELGLVIVTGCSHAGIVNIVEHAKRVSGVQRIACVLGGFHLIGAEAKRISWTVNSLRHLVEGFVAPSHCTGLQAVIALMDTFGDAFKEVGVGSVVHLRAS